MIPSNYVVAGFETLYCITNNFILNKKGRFNDNFSRDDISKFLLNTTAGFLHSYGQAFAGKKSYKNYNKSEAKAFTKCRDSGFFNNNLFLADSGGFQISTNKLTIKESKLLLILYYEFLEEYHHVLDRAFILDIPPGPNCAIFKDFSDLYNLNLQSYLKAKNLPQEVRDKIIYIHHFRSPKLWEIYTKILREYEMFDSFKYHATGGIVANMSSDMVIPMIIYVLPIIPLLNECKKYKRNRLDFHVLGGSNYRDIFFYELFQIHVKKIHNIDLNITYDSSGLFKGLMVGRFIQVYDNNKFTKLDIRSNILNTRFKNNMKVKDKFKEFIHEISIRHPYIKPIKIDEIYEIKEDGSRGTFYEEIKVYSMLGMLDQYSMVQEIMKQKAAEIYSLYEAGELEDFNKESSKIIQSLNSGRVTRKQTVKSRSIIKSLDMLRNLDEDYCEYAVNTFLGKDEFTELDPKQQTLKI